MNERDFYTSLRVILKFQPEQRNMILIGYEFALSDREEPYDDYYQVVRLLQSLSLEGKFDE
jgi:hypothetical protein